MAKFVITRVGDKHNRKVKVVKERVEFHILPFIGCFLLAVGIWMFIVGTQISEDEQRAAHQAEMYPPAGAETQQPSELQTPGLPAQEAYEVPASVTPAIGGSSVSS